MKIALTARAWNWKMGPEWAEKLLVVQVALVEANQAENLQQAVAAAVLGGLVVAVTLDQVREVVVLVVLVASVVVAAQAQAPRMAEMMATPMMIPTKGGKQATLPNHPGDQWPGKNLERVNLHTVGSTSVWG